MPLQEGDWVDVAEMLRLQAAGDIETEVWGHIGSKWAASHGARAGMSQVDALFMAGR